MLPRTLTACAASCAIAGMLLAAPVLAQLSPRPPKPYAALAISRAVPLADPDFVAFRAALAAAAKSRIYAELAALVQPQGFFWDRDFTSGYDARKPAVDNLAAAIALEHNDGAGWRTLAELAAETAAEPLDSRPGVICAPARPRYDEVAFSKLLDATYTTGADWLYPRADDTAVQLVAEPRAPVIARLGPQWVRRMAAERDTGQESWTRVAMPDAKIGFIATGKLRSLDAAQLCYVRNAVGNWRIAGYIAGGR